MKTISTAYEPAQHESAVYTRWEENGAFVPQGEGKSFVVMMPPPNVTGNLHMGHALQDTIMDILIRYHRMAGQPTVWVPGTDHAAIATNKVIETQLAAEGKTRQDVGREEFMRRTQEWYDKTGAEILNQMKRLGSSADWSRSRFTQDEGYVAAVNEAFVRYYERGYIYRGARIVNWDPTTQTTVSDLEIDWKMETTPFYTFAYGPFQISTARPETKFGDKYVVMHPQDRRYAQYKHGDTFKAEWINGPITATIIKDTAVDPAFGSGVMTITPWHDPTDFGIAQRHTLDTEQVIGYDGKLLAMAGEFAGLNIAEARPKVVEKLKAKGLLVSIDENYTHNVALNDRGKGVIEPQIMRQWFMDMENLKGGTITAAKDEVVRFVPPRWKEHFITWMENVMDWNINRQIWLGHRLPVWWKVGTHGSDREEGNFVVSLEKPEGDYEQDPDVLDTWFSSALWPFATLGWPEKTKDLERFYPSSVLVTGRDILYLWVARMIFSGLEFMGKVPFNDVFIHPTVLTKTGKRMSKSLGTGVDPLELIEKYGADATRFGLMTQMSYDQQALKFDEEAIKSARNFVNKVWNLGRLLQKSEIRNPKSETIADWWIQERLAEVASEVSGLLDEYKIGEAARVLYDFVWHDFADWYVEILKVEGSLEIARQVFADMLKLLHPFMPFVTEVLWSQFGDGNMLIWAEWAFQRNAPTNKNMISYFQDIVTTIRSARMLLGIAPKEIVDVYLAGDVPLPKALCVMARAKIVEQSLPNMKSFPLARGEAVAIGSAAITAESIKQARAKLAKEEDQLTEFIARQGKILEQMRGKAEPEAVAEKEAVIEQSKKRLEELKRSQEALK